VDRRRRLQIESTLKHHASPFFLCRPVPRARLPSISDWPDPFWIMRCSTHPRVFFCMPFAGLLETMMAGKFEWQFKHRDEADVNATARSARVECKKLTLCRHFRDWSDL